jgi:tripartite-type tricarboxylate transporter receptor subunit TctC
MTIRKKFYGCAALTFGAAVAFATPAAADAVSDFYKGKSVGLAIGYGAGGGYDTYGRVLARHLGDHIPGKPTVVPKNMPGAGALKAANYIYNSAPKDGTEIGLVASSTLMEPLLGNKQAQFDASKFTWLGSMTSDISHCGVRKGAGVKTFDDWLKTGKELTFGSTGPAAITHQHPLILKNVLGANARVIAGYKGTKDVSLAVQRNEVDGLCGLFVSSINASYLDLVKSGELILLIQMGPKRTSEFGKIPSVFDYAKTKQDRQVLEIHFNQLALARPIMAPPGVPKDRAAALRKAFADTMKDKGLLADAKKVNIDINLVPGDQVEKMLVKFGDYPKAAIEAAKKAIGR